jgi:hypothetical protein
MPYKSEAWKVVQDALQLSLPDIPVDNAFGAE